MEAKGINGTVVFDGTFVTLSRTGAMAKMTVGKGEKKFPVAVIQAVEWKPPSKLIRGFFSFTIAGGNEVTSRPGNRTQSAALDENSVIVGWRQLTEFQAMRSAIEAAIASRYTTAPTPAPAAPVPAAPPPPPNAQPPGWMSDPSDKHELRYYDGTAWTINVSDSGIQTTDALT